MFWLSLLIWLSASQNCTLSEDRACGTIGTTGAPLESGTATCESCEQLCRSQNAEGCCEFFNGNCEWYPGTTTTRDAVNVNAGLIISPSVSPSKGPTKAPYQCVDLDDEILRLGTIPFAFTCEDATYWVATELGFSEEMCDTVSTQYLQGSTFREICCAECAELDKVWVDDDSYRILTGQCIYSNANSGQTTSYVEQRFTAFRECAQRCSETQSCQGFTFNSARPVVCQIHIRAEFHQPFIDDGWQSVVINDGSFVDTSDNNPINGDCMLRITQAPSTAPSVDPTVRPTNLPSVLPTCSPSVDPTTRPSNSPSVLPSLSPSTSPSVDPTTSPSRNPTSSTPSVQPTTSPSTGPTVVPSLNPSVDPTVNPSCSPSVDPTLSPSSDSPSTSPSNYPTSDSPSVSPSVDPTKCPTTDSPSNSPSLSPTSDSPSVSPSVDPSVSPSVDPTLSPSSDSPSQNPTTSPSVDPTTFPTSDSPSYSPSLSPTSDSPSVSPSVDPTTSPSASPSVGPSFSPSNSPTSDSPSTSPTKFPTFTQPTTGPTSSPSTSGPSTSPSVAPSVDPTMSPSSDSPSVAPTAGPSTCPTKFPTGPPSCFPTDGPTGSPRVEPSAGPTLYPSSDSPSVSPSNEPTFEEPTCSPSVDPTVGPSTSPSVEPTKNPSVSSPTQSPSVDPSYGPSTSPTTDEPSISPSVSPSVDPSSNPSYSPSVDPTVSPSVNPSVSPSFGPSVNPTAAPSCSPTVIPSFSPSYTPTITNPCSPADMNILGSDFIALHPEYSSFADDNLKIGIAFPGRYQPISAEFSDAGSDVGKFAGDFSATEFWETPVLHTNEECLYVMQFEMSWNQVLRDQVMGLDLHYEGTSQKSTGISSQQQYFMNTLELTFLENTTSYFFEIDITREINVEIPWLILLQDTVEMTINFTVSIPTLGPTTSPSVCPSVGPSTFPTSDSPSVSPTQYPTSDSPSTSPSTGPSENPTVSPSLSPSVDPTVAPSHNPSVDPSVSPSIKPTKSPTNEPTVEPTVNPTNNPTLQPTNHPTNCPTVEPTLNPTGDPTTSLPSVGPTTIPSNVPSVLPTVGPSTSPSVQPTDLPSVDPTVSPSTKPSTSPSTSPTKNPSLSPSVDPTVAPTLSPSVNPSTDPTVSPSVGPTQLPSVVPTTSPSTGPSKSPTPREEISFAVNVEAWETFNLGQYIDANDHTGETMEVMTVTDVGSFSLGGSVVALGQQIDPSDLVNTGYSPEVVTTNTSTTFVIQGDHERYTFNINVVSPSPCVGEWGDWSACSVTCDTGSQSRTFSVETPADPFGDDCVADDNEVETQTCQVVECPVLDKVILEFAVAEPTLTGTTKVSFNFTTLVQWPWKTLEPGLTTDSDCWDVLDDDTALSSRIVDNSENFWITNDCVPDYIYGRFPGYCVGKSNSAAVIPAVYIRGADEICPNPNDLEDCKVHPICEEICTNLDACEGFDIFYDRPDTSRWVCEVLGQNITSVDRNWVEENYDVTPWFFFRFDIFTPESPISGNIPPAQDVDCYLRDTPVYEGDCQQDWHGEFVVDGVCDVNGEYTTTICVQHQETLTIDKIDVTLSASLDTACAEVVDTLTLEGTIETFADDSYSFTTNIYHVGDLVFTRSTVVSRTELTGISLVGLVADQGFDPPDLFGSVVSQNIQSLSVLNQQTNNYETVLDFSFTLDNVDGSGDGIATTLAATFEATYVDGSRRMLALDTSTHAPIGASETLIVYPAPCQDPVAAYGQYLTETCEDDIRILKCDEDGTWTTIVNEWSAEICPSSSGVYISEQAPDELDSPDSRTIYINNDSNDNDSIILTAIIVGVVAFLVALAVYLYIEYYGNCLNKDRKTIISFDESMEGVPSKRGTLGAPTAGYTPSGFYEPEMRQPTSAYNDNLNYQDHDDNVSEISVSSSIKEEQAMHMVFGQIFDETRGRL